MQAAEQQLEDVYRVAPVPEEYMKYQLHLNTGLEMDKIDQWFKDRRGGATVTTGMKGSAAWEKDPRSREPAASNSVSTGHPRLQVPAGAANPPPPQQQPLPDQEGQPADRLKGGTGTSLPEPGQGSRQNLMGPPQPMERPRNAPDRSMDAHVGMPALDWLGEPNGHSRPANSGAAEAPSASRQASGALIETMDHPNNASFLLSFMDGAPGKEADGSKEHLPGSFRPPAPNGRSLAASLPASYPSASAGGSRPSSSGRSAGEMPPPPAQNISSQQRSWPDSANAHRARGGHWGAAALDHFDAHSASDKQMREWYGSSDHTGLSLPGASSGLNRSWRLQQWDIRGGPPASQPQFSGADPLIYPLPITSHSGQDGYPQGSDASQQYEAAERGQELQRSTASLPELPQHNYRQELLGGFPSRSHDGRRSTADLSSWRRPNFYIGSAPQQTFMPDIPVPQNAQNSAAALHSPPGLAAHLSDPTPLANQALASLVDNMDKRRSAPLPLPRSVSDLSDTHQRFGSAGGSGSYLADSRSASDGAAHASGDLLLPEDPGSSSEVRFVEQDLDCVAGLIGLQTIASVEEHEGSRQLFLFEQLTHLDSLSLDGNVAANPGKRRRVRHQHFWRNSDKLPPEHRLYVTSADIKLALEQAEPVKPRRQITSAERTNMWTVCLTSQGVLGYLNRRVSPLGVRLFRAAQEQATGGRGGNTSGQQKTPSLPALLLPKPKPPAAPSSAEPKEEDDQSAGVKKRRTSLRRAQP